jgi:Ca-activated chloride channel family protein
VDAGFSLSILGVGSEQGAPIPKLAGGFVTDGAGQIAVARLEERSLRRLAAAGGGRYATLSSDDRDLNYLLSGEVGTRRATDDSMVSDQWREEGPWLALLLLPLGALAFRRGWVVVLVAALLPLPQPAEASFWDDLWRTKDQQGQRQLQDGNPGEAAELFQDTEWQAVASYEAGAYADSAAGFAERGDTRSLYNLGNALARQGEFESAIDAYEEVLELEPDNEDAAFNRDLLEQLMSQSQEEQQGEGEQQESSNQSGGESQQSGGEDSSEQQSQEGSSQSDSESGQQDPSQREQDMSEEDMKALQEELQRAAEEAEQSEGESRQLTAAELDELRREQEQQQAMEQWLRRIPNDPGGLLRRKFRYQYQRMGRDQDGNNLWPDDEVQPW